MMNEHELYTTIQKMLNSKLGDGREDIDIEVHDRDVIIKGTRDTLDEKKQVERYVRDIEDVGDITNNIIIATGIPDETISRDIQFNLDESDGNIDDLTVNVNAGRVTISGRVDSEERKESVINSIKTVTGVLSIEDNIEII